MTRGQDSLTMDMHADFQADGENEIGVSLAEVLIVAPTAKELAEHEALLAVLDKEVKGSCLLRQ